jgi:alpha-1,2-mannosyltransferase
VAWLTFSPAQDFTGQLPKAFAEGPNATSLIPTDMNDMNREEARGAASAAADL